MTAFTKLMLRLGIILNVLGVGLNLFVFYMIQDAGSAVTAILCGVMAILCHDALKLRRK